MAALVCLQGGGEFARACRDLDLAVLRSVLADRPVVALPAAAAPGGEYVTAGRNAARHYRSLTGEVAVVAPDPRDDPEGATRAVEAAGLLVLPGGSPSRLHDVLVGTPLGGLVTQRHDAGELVVSGASAGAMVL